MCLLLSSPIDPCLSACSGKCSVELYNQEGCKGKEWKSVLQEWLSLFRLMRNPRSFYLNQFFKEVLLYRFAFWIIPDSQN